MTGQAVVRRTPRWLAPLLVVLLAAFFRLWALSSLPPGLFGDEATNGLDALDVLAGRGAVFFPANFGREGLHIWLVAGAFRLLGVTPLAVRLPSVLAGIATALATYWLGIELGRAIARDRQLPLMRHLPVLLATLSALYLGTSFWHVHFSRFGIRGVFTPLCGALAFAAFWRGVNQRGERPASDLASRRWHSAAWFAISGLFLGLGVHFYTASRFLPVFLAGYLVLQAVLHRVAGRRDPSILRRDLGPIMLLFLVAAVVFAPLGIYFWQHPGSFAQRAGEVIAFGEASPLTRMGRAAVANVAQFFVPGHGDAAQFYNLPGRSVFDPLTAGLALLGMAVAVAWCRQPAPLFLLTWWLALLVPSFLATDRMPTLPRVLGTIPGVYFFPAIGLLALIAGLRGLVGRINGRDGLRQQTARPWVPSRGQAVGWAGVALLAVTVHAGLTFRDYFLVWGPSRATFDAFEGDMTATWHWLEENPPDQHVYLSSDLYRHPTFMLLSEHATVTEYFSHANPGLSWFDARAALPLPPAGQGATYLISTSAPLGAEAAQLPDPGPEPRQVVPGPDGRPAVQVLEVGAGPRTDDAGAAFTAELWLEAWGWLPRSDGAPQLWLRWLTVAPATGDWQGYRLEIMGETGGREWKQVAPFDSYRPAEWVAGGTFYSWPLLTDAPPGEARNVRLRLIRASDDVPVTTPTAPQGWHTLPQS